jgi:hypothetical protein
LNIRRVVEVGCVACDNRKLLKAVEQVSASCCAAGDDIGGTEGVTTEELGRVVSGTICALVERLMVKDKMTMPLAHKKR